MLVPCASSSLLTKHWTSVFFWVSLPLTNHLLCSTSFDSVHASNSERFPKGIRQLCLHLTAVSGWCNWLPIRHFKATNNCSTVADLFQTYRLVSWCVADVSSTFDEWLAQVNQSGDGSRIKRWRAESGLGCHWPDPLLKDSGSSCPPLLGSQRGLLWLLTDPLRGVQVSAPESENNVLRFALGPNVFFVDAICCNIWCLEAFAQRCRAQPKDTLFMRKEFSQTPEFNIRILNWDIVNLAKNTWFWWYCISHHIPHCRSRHWTDCDVREHDTSKWNPNGSRKREATKNVGCYL